MNSSFLSTSPEMLASISSEPTVVTILGNLNVKGFIWSYNTLFIVSCLIAGSVALLTFLFILLNMKKRIKELEEKQK